MSRLLDRNELAVLHVSNLDPKVSNEQILYELFTQFGVVRRVKWGMLDRTALPAHHHLMRDGGGASHLLQDAVKGDYCYVEMKDSADAEYAYKVCRGSRIRLFGREIRVLYKAFEMAQALHKEVQTGIPAAVPVSRHGGLFEVGAKLFVSNLSRTLGIDELTKFFSAFGRLAAAVRMVTDKDGFSKGACIVSFEDFETSDRVIVELNGQVYHDRIISVGYADLGDGSGRKHGHAEERANAVMFIEAQKKHESQIKDAKQTLQQNNQQQQAAAGPAWAQGINPYGSSGASAAASGPPPPAAPSAAYYNRV